MDKNVAISSDEIHEENDLPVTSLRRSSRESKPTERMAEYRREESEKRHRKLYSMYESWVQTIKHIRSKLKSECSEAELSEMISEIKFCEDNVLREFELLRQSHSVLPEVVRKVDACTAVTIDFMKIINERLCGIDPFDYNNEMERLRALRKTEYAKSIFSSVTNGSAGNISAAQSQVSMMMADAAADLAAKATRYRLMQDEEQERAKLVELELEQRKALDEKQSLINKIAAKHELEVAQARLDAYSQLTNVDVPVKEMKREVLSNTSHEVPKESGLSADASSFQPHAQGLTYNHLDSVPSNNIINVPQSHVQPSVTLPAIQQPRFEQRPHIGNGQDVVVDSKSSPIVESAVLQPVANSDAATFAKVLDDSVNLNRLPITEPSVFAGDPLQYIEWKTSFEMLIEHKGIPPQEKIFYLKKYVAGPARKALEGFFYSNSKSAFDNAKRVLEERYGHPFVMQKAFRDKLDQWPKISSKDSIGLRDLADFLQGCNDAIPHVPSLSVLNDCTENQKLLSKLPEWLSARWNREVTQSLVITNTYPSFSQFVDFMVKEARVACNPVSSLFALRCTERKESKERKSNTSVVKTFTTTTSTTENRSRKCSYCGKEGHLIFKCDGFTSLSIECKRSFVKDKNLCFGCLRKGHLNKDCKRKHICLTCKGKHPTCLHEERSPLSSQTLDKEPTVLKESANSFRVSKGETQGTSMIVPVWVSCQENPSREILTYALLDTQSDTSFILDETASALQLTGQPIHLSLSTMTSRNTVIDSLKVSRLRVRGFKSTDSVEINHAYTRGFIPADRSHIPVKETVSNWDHLQQLANELPPLQSCEVGLLIGYNCPQALAPRKILTGQDNEPYAVQTLLGWSVVGYSNLVTNCFVSSISHRTSVREIPVCSPREAIRALESDFAHDKGDHRKVSQEDIRFINHLSTNIRQREDKHLEMPLPFRERPILPNNRPFAFLRLDHLKRKFKKDNKYHNHYNEYMSEMISRGDAEVVGSEGEIGNIWYIPHHGVYHPKKPDKLRVVFDCSARYNESSLNQHLLTGPDLTNGLTGVLCRFRRYPVAIMCDVEKMFHQFYVQENDRDFLRFLWWEDGNINKEPSEYRMRVHLFGAASSPGCANYGFKYLAKTQESEFSSAASFVQHDFYVDDGLISVELEAEAIQLINDTQKLCMNGGLRLHKFVSNNKAVIESIPISERSVDVKNLNLALDELSVERALGIKWSIEADTFNFEVTIKNPTPTRRNMLSIVASVFDPLGLLSPLMLKGKRILQEMCQNGIGWDETAPNSVKPAWEGWVDDMLHLNLVKIPRCLKPLDFKKPYTTELHHFSDASSIGYGQCSYIRFIGEDKVYCSLIMAKARVAPSNVVTIPRLELTAAVLSVKVSNFLREELNLEIEHEYFWTDSRVVLGYISNEARRFHVFVANRVQIIRDATKIHQWSYISSDMNPADHASRGLSSSELCKSTWFSGPAFLWQRTFETDCNVPELLLGDPEVRPARSLCTKTTTLPSSILHYLDRFSCWSSVVYVIARLQRLSNGIKGTHPPTVEERQGAERTIIGYVQHDAFQDTFNALEASNPVPKTNHLYPLDPILQGGLLRVGGRLRKANLPSSLKHPLIIPKGSHIAQIILAHVHEGVQHQGRGITLNKLRSYGYWIVGGSKTVANYIHRCVVCRKLRRPTELQKMADLPKERIEPSPPFTYCGMDCFGPFIIKQGRKEIKRYGLLLTCMCSRAIHIEMLDDMSTDAFINGLRCFIAIRGSVRQIRSDQGSNFIGAKNEFEKLTSFLSKNQCDFVMNTPCSSHTGGVWERQIRTVRSVLSSVLLLCPGRLDDCSLRTLFYEAMSIVNSRPLTVNEIDDPNVLEPLTPNHILTAKSEIPYPPPGKFVKEDLYLRKRWRRVQYLLEQFWSRWRREYVAQISLRQKWHSKRRNIQVGDIVLVKDIDLPRNQWPLAKVMEAAVDDDGFVRKVKVKLGNRLKEGSHSSTLERSVHKLVLLMEY